MKKLTFLLFVLILACKDTNTKSDFDFETVFEKSQGTQTATYQETISYFTELANLYSEIAIHEIGETDSGKPLHIVTLNPDAEFDFESIRKNKRIILINNGIHPGESDGIDATMMLYRDIAKGKIDLPDNVVLVNIPVYNIGGSLNRNSGTRANQNGPEEYGFRGNARNYDLNRDFIKCDTKNARAFAEVYHLVKPDVFIENHVSNGADYQYTLTHLITQHNKLGGELGAFLHETIQPEFEQKLKEKNWDITPYVNVWNNTPEHGFSQFFDNARYSSGYTTLFNTIGFMVETHMLKPYKQRVEGTYDFMLSMIEVVEDHSDAIDKLRKNMPSQLHKNKTYTLEWEVDTTKHSILKFMGFEGEYITSEVTGAKRLKYNHDKPYTKDVVYQNYFKPKTQVEIPSAYIIPQGWHHVLDLLKLNQVEFKMLDKDSTITVESYRITDYKTRTRAYEGHYPHYNTSFTKSIKEVTFSKGDYIIPTKQYAFRYLMETLEPHAPDSYFNWNFFDTILQKKEHFSPYVFEDTAKQMLDSNPELKAEFEAKKAEDETFKTNWYAQLVWLYERSEHYDTAYLQYPVYRTL
ncbi:MAG: M14 family metallopeptidase [Bacteroidia bacterium]|nr:M14 family metallopeptidase [Bacteroidia bacterium]